MRTLQQHTDVLLWEGYFHAVDPHLNPIHSMPTGKVCKQNSGLIVWSNRALYPESLSELLRCLEGRDAAYLLLSTYRWPDRMKHRITWIGPTAARRLPHPRPWMGTSIEHGRVVRAIGPRPHWIIVDPAVLRAYFESLGRSLDLFLQNR